MIINLNQFGNSGGGGSGYTLPVATSSVLGGVKVGSGLTITSAGTLSADAQPVGIATTATTGVVKIGSGITVDSAGTISIDSQGIEIVTSLPASGYDGQTVMLIENLQEQRLSVQKNIQASTLSVSVTAVGLTNAVTVWNYEWFGSRIYVTVNPDNSVDLYNDYDGVTTNYPVSADSYTYTQPNGQENNLTLTIGESGFTIVSENNIAKENVLQDDIYIHQQEIETLYTWSDEPLLVSDINYTQNDTGDWCVNFKYSDLPEGTLCVWKQTYGEEYRHLVCENGKLKTYSSNSPTAITATTGSLIPQYTNKEELSAIVYWTDDVINIYRNSYCYRISINTDIFYKTGWHKETEHKISNKVIYNGYTWYNEDNEVIIKHFDYPMYNVYLKLNPNSSFAGPYQVYSRSSNSIGPFFAPTTTGNTGYVCVAGNGWAEPTWAEPSTLTNGVKFWKGTQDQYDAIITKDASTLYIIIPE